MKESVEFTPARGYGRADVAAEHLHLPEGEFWRVTVSMGERMASATARKLSMATRLAFVAFADVVGDEYGGL